MDYHFQVEQKGAILREVLRRVGKIEFSGDIGTITGEPWQYRNRAQLHFDDGKVGYFEHGSHRLCAIDHCPIVSPALNNVISTMQGQVPRSFTGSVEFFTNRPQAQVNMLDGTPRRNACS